uniref:Putative secreted protein n=1 Tax=Amblyomma triste TaxID=251400 RepID=A0A023G1N3_AMBTT
MKAFVFGLLILSVICQLSRCGLPGAPPGVEGNSCQPDVSVIFSFFVFSSVQSFSRVGLFVTLSTMSRHAFRSLTIFLTSHNSSFYQLSNWRQRFM